MKLLRKLFFGFLVFTTASATAQENSDMALVETYLEANNSLDQYEFAYDQLLSMLRNQYPETAANAEGWKYLQENKGKAIAEMESLLSPIYQSNFTNADLEQMISFYNTDTGKQMLSDRGKMSQDQKNELNSYYNTEVGQKVIEKQSILSESISMASENWSRNLYETAVSLLKNE